ncbi:hypothetical protein [Methylomonas sp. MK1]|uniref:hypothetical protein n=1 Tax=Methylomonas sp. MK1 TaxID=1131552 RepID=UPI000362530D|nr:hypothetical protein [Methylomonas sp. MK1]
MEADNETSFPLSVSVTLIHGRPFKKPAPSPSQISTGTGDQISPGANKIGVNMFGKYSAIKALRDVEFSCSKAYGQALLDYQLPLALRSLIETKLLPNLQSNMRTLDQLLDAVMA